MQQPNVSHLYRNGNTNTLNKVSFRPPLPTSKPPVRSTSQIPTKMQSLDQSVVAKFLQAVEKESPSENKQTFKSEATFAPQKSTLWKQPDKTDNCVNSRRNSNENAVVNNGNSSPSWMNKTLKPVNGNGYVSTKIPSEVVKPIWNAKGLESSTNVWSPPSSTTNGNVVNNRISMSTTDWKAKYEESERKRKELLGENQKTARENGNLEKRIQKLESDYKTLQNLHQEKTQQLTKLSQVSEKVYQDYDKLNSKYEVETTAMHKALGIASKWYMENKKLRRASVARPMHEPNPIDEIDGEDHELDELRKTVQDLSVQVGQLQSELKQAKLQEYEAQEQCATLLQQLEEEKEKSCKQIKELKELRLMREKFESVTVMVQGEVQALRSQRDKAIEDAKRLQGESHEAKRERNVLVHQSTLLMGDITPDDRMFTLLLEIEELKRKLEDSEQQHTLEIQDLQERIEAKEPDSHVELLEEKLKLAESELQLALERVELLEQQKSTPSSPSNIPCPPPPPPPPPMPPMAGAFKAPQKKTEGDSLEDMAKLLGIQRTPKPPTQQGGAIDDIINELKGGKFNLKSTEKVANKQKEEQPAAVQEMLSIIGTLKRRPKHSPAQVYV